MADLSNLSDGTYGRELGRISPEGNMYGATRWVRDVLSNFWWNGAEWLEIGWDIGQSASVSLLPTTTQDPDTVWRCLDRAENGTYIWKYFFWDVDTDGWLPIEWYWTVESRQALDNITAYRRGEAHEVREPDVQAMWDGYTWRRVRISSLDDDLGIMSGLVGLAATAQEQQEDHNLLLESYLGSTATGNTVLDERASALEHMLTVVTLASSDFIITQIEALSIGHSLDEFEAEADTLLLLATGLGITTEKDAYNDAVALLGATLREWWVGKPNEAYPILAPLSMVDTLATMDSESVPFLDARLLIKECFDDAQITKDHLVNEIAIQQAITNFDEGFDVSQFKLTYNGFVRGMTPELALVYISENELCLQPNYSDFDYLAINEQNVQASKRTSVFLYTPVLGWNEETQSLYYSTLQPSTTYWVYLANRSAGFNLNIYDFRGKLFCSDTYPSSNYLGEAGLGLNAILIGQAETSAAGKFLHNLDVSLISRQSNTKETFREFSDFDLEYTDEDTLTLKRTNGTAGQIYIPENLYFLGENREIYTTSPRIAVDGDELISYDNTTISNNTLYYVFIAADSDIYNLNELNPDTSLPWHPEDTDDPLGEGYPHYDADKDFRLWLFLSLKEPEDGRLALTYQGYWARHIGQVRTDGIGKFIYSGGISAIRQAILQPEYFDGLAEISLADVSNTMFKVIRKRGTSGIVMVGGKATQAYDTDNPLVHIISITDPVYIYNGETPEYPLTATNNSISHYANTPLYLYLANDRPCWGDVANRFFVCDSDNTGILSTAYLSENYPGNNARYIAKITTTTGNLGVELVGNKTFTDEGDWSFGVGWIWSNVGQNVSFLFLENNYIDIVSTQISCEGWSKFSSCVVTQTTPTGDITNSDIYHAISFDGGITYKVFKGSAWVIVAYNNSGTWQYNNAGTLTNASSNTLAQALIQSTNQTAYQWTKADIEAMVDTDWEATGGWSASVATLDWGTVLVYGSNSSHGDDNTGEQYATTLMTDDTTPYPCIVTSSQFYSTYYSYKAFNQTTSVGDGWFKSGGDNINTTTPASLVYDFGAGVSKVINKYRIMTGHADYSPRDWKLQGSNNAAADYGDAENANGWVTLDTQTGQTWTANVWGGWYTFSNAVGYRKYRLRVTNNNNGGDTSLWINEFHLVESLTAGVTPTPVFTEATLCFSLESPDTLQQDITIDSPNNPHEVTVIISTRQSGYVTPVLGGTSGNPLSASGTHTQTIAPASVSGGIELIPSVDFVGTIDAIYCSSITSSVFSGQYISDAIVSENLAIDNYSIGPGILWDSSKIMQVINAAVASQNAGLLLASEKTQGLPLKLTYTDATNLTLTPTTGIDLTLAFPDLSLMTIPLQGITFTIEDSDSTPYTIADGNTNTSIISITDGMCSNTTPIPNVASSTAYNSGLDPWYAFVRGPQARDGSHYATQYWFPSSLPASIVYDFGQGNRKVINKYAMEPLLVGSQTKTPTDWKLQGSNDAAAAAADGETANGWTTLDTQTGQTTVWATWKYEYKFSNSNAYQKYRLRVTSANSGELRLAKIDYIEAQHSPITFTKYYVYLTYSEDPETALSISITPPDNTYEKLETLGDTKILVGWISLADRNVMFGDWNVYSYWNQPTQTWSSEISGVWGEFYLPKMNGVIFPNDELGSLSRTGYTSVSGGSPTRSVLLQARALEYNIARSVCADGYDYAAVCNVTKVNLGSIEIAGIYDVDYSGISISCDSYREIPCGVFYDRPYGFNPSPSADMLILTRQGS